MDEPRMENLRMGITFAKAVKMGIGGAFIRWMPTTRKCLSGMSSTPSRPESMQAVTIGF